MFDAIFFDLGDTLVSAADPGRWLPGAKSVVERLSAAGIRIGLISNTGDLDREGLRPLLPKDFPWALLEDRLIVVSGEHPWAKPSPEIFRFAIEQTGAAGRRSLYCSESLVETIAAQEAGMCSARLYGDGLGELITLVAPPVAGSHAAPVA